MPNHVSSEHQLLHVIKASAGSGKTHRLTGEYLRLLFSAPNNHRHILAVTFTNKATDEMKSRIVEELYRLASGADSPYLHELMSDFSIQVNEVRKISKGILETILHDYSSFAISTIDRFFQQTMRSFAREIGLAGGYNIELDETALLTETIDLMFSELDKPDNKSLSEWLLRFMQQNIEEGKSWKIEQQVLDLAKQLFNETYKSFNEEELTAIEDKHQLVQYKKMLTAIVLQYEKELKSVGLRALSVMQQHNLSHEDFKHKRNSGFLLFSKLAVGVIEKPSNRLRALVDEVELWHSKTDKEDAIKSAFSEGLNDCVRQIIHLSDNDKEYQTAKHLLRNFYTLGILNNIKFRLQKLQQENNTLFLSDTTELLNDIIAGADSPFIYEKTGTRIHHFMIDEFQDTSRMQWQNFKPLIGESLASGNMNLIVGDVKQSIYRFRNSDWQLLEEQVKLDFHAESIVEHVLDTNWRSDTHIVQFNNAFFANAAVNLQNDFNNATEEQPYAELTDNTDQQCNTEITDAYADLYQNIPSKKSDNDGHVKISFLRDDKDTDWKSEALNRLPLEIEALQDQGFSLNEIAIVVRWNHEAVLVAETLLAYREQHPSSQYRYDIISNEALLVGSAQSVKAVIALMRHFRNPNDDIARMMAVYESHRLRSGATPEEALLFYREGCAGDFPEEFKAQINELSSMSFYEMTEHFFSLMSDVLDKNENAYVQAFLDIVLKFKNDNSADLNHFLDWWDEKGHKKALFSPESQDAIRLITIHKSKGLGFGAVIMPFVRWSMDHNAHHTDIVWCKPEVAPFNELRIAPLKYGKGLENTIFRDDYLEEKRLTYIDNINLLYVAFTRAKHRLIVFAPLPKKPEIITDVCDLLWRSLSDSSDYSKRNIPLHEYLKEVEDSSNEEDTEALVSIFEYGSPDYLKQQQKKQHVEQSKTDHWQSVPFGDRLQLRLNAIAYFNNDGSRDYGNMMHAIVSNVKTLADIPEAVAQKISAGELHEDERMHTVNTLTEMLSLPEISEWYSGKFVVLNETLLLHPSTGFSRPDRVMIGDDEVIVVDYKFGEIEESKYTRQVQRYMKSIQDMGYRNVKGYICYMKLGKIVKIS